MAKEYSEVARDTSERGGGRGTGSDRAPHLPANTSAIPEPWLLPCHDSEASEARGSGHGMPLGSYRTRD